MSSEAITQNDLREILSRTVGSIPSEYRKLLWTNPSPTSSFSAQTVALDLSSYDDVEIEMVGDTTNANTTQNFKLTVGVGSLLDISANNIWWRYVTPRTTGVEFGAGYKTTTYGSGATLTNTQMVPLKIYGIKYERVNPPQISGWDYITSVTGSNTATFTNLATQGYSEVFVRDNTYSGGYVPVIALPTILTWGGFYSGINGLLHGVDITTTSIKGRYGMTDSTNYLATTTFSLYAR